uniref:Prenylcysteine lyase domain-containing protein n=1 Tax=Auxenochlorella protothecoides TaxID=3075 RepID=A0A1D1ZW00_AUXPR
MGPAGATQHLGLLALLIGLQCMVCASSGPHIGVVGAGIGGAASAHWIRSLLGDQVQITVFERSTSVGGRTSTTPIGNASVDTAFDQVAHHSQYIRELADSQGLTVIGHIGVLPPAIFDGRSLVWAESPWWLVNLVKAVWRWGLNPWLLQRYSAQFWDRFSAVYELQTQGQAYDSPEDLLRAAGVYDDSQVTLFEAVEAALGEGGWGTDLFKTEVVGAITRGAYGQTSLQLNALSGAAALLAVTDPGGFSIEGGFPGLASALLDSANASLHLGAEVRSIARSPGSDRLQLAWADAAAGGGAAIAAQSGDFDGIILAAPLEGSQLDLAGVPDLAPRFPRSFVSTVTTLVRGRVRASYFGQPAATQLQYGRVLVTADSPVPFSSLAKVQLAPGQPSLWRLTSPKTLSHAWLSIVFEAGWQVADATTWAAYPRSDPPEDFSPFLLARGLWYNNALESVAGSLEAAAMSALNTALLVKRDVKARLDGT